MRLHTGIQSSTLSLSFIIYSWQYQREKRERERKNFDYKIPVQLHIKDTIYVCTTKTQHTQKKVPVTLRYPLQSWHGLCHTMILFFLHDLTSLCHGFFNESNFVTNQPFTIQCAADWPLFTTNMPLYPLTLLLLPCMQKHSLKCARMLLHHNWDCSLKHTVENWSKWRW